MNSSVNTGRGADQSDPLVQIELIRAQIEQYEAERTESQQLMQKMRERVNQLEANVDAGNRDGQVSNRGPGSADTPFFRTNP